MRAFHASERERLNENHAQGQKELEKSLKILRMIL